MADHWNIHRSDGSELGPLTPLEVRDALRDGSIEPFDLVSRVGSKIKLPLVEVDEIFLSAEEAEKAKVDSIYEKKGPLDEKEEVTLASTPIKMVANMPSSSVQTAVSRPDTPSYPKVKSAAKRHAKKYFLIDKKKRYNGPLSAPEIQSLFSRGLLQPGVFVVKDRDGPRVPAQQFVSAYLGARAKKLSSEVTKFDFDTITKSKRAGLPSSKHMDLWARTVAHQAYIAPQRFPYMTACLIIIAIMVLSVLGQNYLLPRFHEWKAERASDEALQVVPSTDVNEIKIRPIQGEEEAPIVVRKDTAAPAKPLKANVDPVKKRQPKTQPRRSTTQPTYAVPRLPTYATPPKKPAAAPASKFYTSGQQISVPVSFDLGALEACGVKCTLNVKDGSGKVLEAVFFKGQYESSLKKKAGRATFGGRIDVQGARTILYLQSVH